MHKVSHFDQNLTISNKRSIPPLKIPATTYVAKNCQNKYKFQITQCHLSLTGVSRVRTGDDTLPHVREKLKQVVEERALDVLAGSAPHSKVCNNKMIHTLLKEKL